MATKTAPLRLAPYAWAKLTYIRDIGPTEVGFFALSAPDDPLLIVDLFMPAQEATVASVELDGDSLAEHLEANAALDPPILPARCSRIWVHTHPGSSPNPSGQDETAFSELYGTCPWSIMLIVARDGSTYARLQFASPPAEVLLKVIVDFSQPFPPSDHAAWRAEYDKQLSRRIPETDRKPLTVGGSAAPLPKKKQHKQPPQLESLACVDCGYVWEDDNLWADCPQCSSPDVCFADELDQSRHQKRIAYQDTIHDDWSDRAFNRALDDRDYID